MDRIFKISVNILLQCSCLILINVAELQAQKKVKLVAIASTCDSLKYTVAAKFDSIKCDSLNCKVAPKFGRAPIFIIYNLENGRFTVVNNMNPNATGAGTNIVNEMIKRNVDAVITQDCGMKSFDILRSASIRVFSDVKGTVNNAIADFKKGKLKEKK